jgi:type I restriction enzyme M protein
MVDLQQELLALLTQHGGLGNTRARQLLGWDEATYDRVKQALVASGQVALGRGRGGTIRLANADQMIRRSDDEKIANAAEPVGQWANGLTAAMPPPVLYPTAKRKPGRPPKADKPQSNGLSAAARAGQEASTHRVHRKGAKKPQAQEPLEKQLWKAADKLRKNIDAAEYKHIVLGLVFLKYISDAFVELYDKLKAEESAGADPEDKDEYKAENIFFVPPSARWSFLQSHAKQPTIGLKVDEAMDAIERENASLKGVLPKVYARQNLDPTSLGGLIDLIGNIALGDAKSRSADVLGHVFEYFLGEFALAEGKKGGQFYTPRSVVELLVNMLEPYKGRVFDPCCGSGGMFVQSEKFIIEHQGKINDISIYGQESNQTTWRLAKMNLAIRGLDSSQVKWNSEGSFLNDAHPDLKADYIIANPPFNVSDWGGELLRTDGRWKYGVPPTGNANFAWMQHFIHHLSPNGQAGVVLSKGALTSKSSGEGEIRKAMVEAGLIDCIVNLPPKLFLNTQIPASLWFMSRNRRGGVTSGGVELRDRRDEILFIDARHLGHLINRRTRELSADDIKTITDTYHNWRNKFPSSGGVAEGRGGAFPSSGGVPEGRGGAFPSPGGVAEGRGGYTNIPGFCFAAPLSRVRELDYVLTPGRYVGLADEDDDFDFAERFAALKLQFEEQLKEEAALNAAILENLKKVKIDG